jgi:hypothetical protein
MEELIILLIPTALILGFIIFIIASERYDKGYNKGHSEGYDKGHSEGFHKGYSEGYDKGHSEGFHKGHSEGYDKGISEGQSKGYDKGYNIGYNEGHTRGYLKGSEDHKVYKIIVDKSSLESIQVLGENNDIKFTDTEFKSQSTKSEQSNILQESDQVNKQPRIYKETIPSYIDGYLHNVDFQHTQPAPQHGLSEGGTFIQTTPPANPQSPKTTALTDNVETNSIVSSSAEQVVDEFGGISTTAKKVHVRGNKKTYYKKT